MAISFTTLKLFFTAVHTNSKNNGYYAIINGGYDTDTLNNVKIGFYSPYHENSDSHGAKTLAIGY